MSKKELNELFKKIYKLINDEELKKEFKFYYKTSINKNSIDEKIINFNFMIDTFIENIMKSNNIDIKDSNKILNLIDKDLQNQILNIFKSLLEEFNKSDFTNTNKILFFGYKIIPYLNININSFSNPLLEEIILKENKTEEDKKVINDFITLYFDIIKNKKRGDVFSMLIEYRKLFENIIQLNIPINEEHLKIYYESIKENYFEEHYNQNNNNNNIRKDVEKYINLFNKKIKKELKTQSEEYIDNNNRYIENIEKFPYLDKINKKVLNEILKENKVENLISLR